jgi:hypothetical protein
VKRKQTGKVNMMSHGTTESQRLDMVIQGNELIIIITVLIDFISFLFYFILFLKPDRGPPSSCCILWSARRIVANVT